VSDQGRHDTLADTEAIASFLHVRPATVRSWAHRGQLERRGRDRRGRTLYSVKQAQGLAPFADQQAA